MPQFLAAMARNIKVQFLGTLAKDEAVARSLAQTTSMQEGSVKQSWLDVVLQGRAADDVQFGAKLQCRVMLLCPEHADKMTEWKNLSAFCTRVGAAVYEAITSFMAEHGMQGPPYRRNGSHRP